MQYTCNSISGESVPSPWGRTSSDDYDVQVSMRLKLAIPVFSKRVENLPRTKKREPKVSLKITKNKVLCDAPQAVRNTVDQRQDSTISPKGWIPGNIHHPSHRDPTALLQQHRSNTARFKQSRSLRPNRQRAAPPSKSHYVDGHHFWAHRLSIWSVFPFEIFLGGRHIHDSPLRVNYHHQTKDLPSFKHCEACAVLSRVRYHHSSNVVEANSHKIYVGNGQAIDCALSSTKVCRFFE